jgi:hypothetical protein
MTFWFCENVFVSVTVVLSTDNINHDLLVQLLFVQKYLLCDTARSSKRNYDTMNPAGAGDVGGNPLPPEPVPVPEITDHAASDEDDSNEDTAFIDALQCFHDAFIARLLVKNPITDDDMMEFNWLFQLVNEAYQSKKGAMEQCNNGILTSSNVHLVTVK